jgi:hypothetical protein
MAMSATSAVGAKALGTGDRDGDDTPSVSPEHAGQRLKRFVPLVAAGLVAVAYLVYLLHFAVAAPVGDEWVNNIPLLDQAIHGHLSFSRFWDQYFQSRMLFPNLIFVLIGIPTHYDPRWFVVLNAIFYIASFFLVLAAVRRYLQRDLQVLPTFIFALIWFSLAAVYDALWAFEVGYYLVLLSFAVVLYSLLVPARRRPLWFSIALVAAVVGSYSFVQGLLLWPMGLVILLFSVPFTRRVVTEIAIWVGGAVVTTGLFFWHFDFAGDNGVCTKHCGVGYTLSHPGLALSYWMRMVGNIFPSVNAKTGTPQIIVGVILTAAAVFVVVQSIRERPTSPMVALPLGMTVFALLWDMIIVSGRVGLGNPGFGEYTLVQVILLAGISIFAWGHADRLFRAAPVSNVSWNFVRVACIGLSVLVLAQIVSSSKFGWDDGHSISLKDQQSAQVSVNLAAIPADLQDCYLDAILDDDLVPLTDLGPTRAAIILAQRDRLGMFGPAVIGHFRAEGPPHVPLLRRVCSSRSQ